LIWGLPRLIFSSAFTSVLPSWRNRRWWTTALVANSDSSAYLMVENKAGCRVGQELGQFVSHLPARRQPTQQTAVQRRRNRLSANKKRNLRSNEIAHVAWDKIDLDLGVLGFAMLVREAKPVRQRAIWVAGSASQTTEIELKPALLASSTHSIGS
jgi:hypothetical protein